MRQATRFLLLTGLTGWVLIVLALSQASFAADPTPTLPNLHLTATAIHNAILGTAETPFTPTPEIAVDHAAHLTTTVEAIRATRTAIALTRNPALAVTPTPHPVQQTATHIVALTLHTPVPATPSSTPTATSTLTSTPQPCAPFIETRYLGNLSETIQTALTTAEIDHFYVDVLSVGVVSGDTPDCTQFDALSTFFDVNLRVESIAETGQLIDALTRTLAVLTDFPPEVSYGFEVRLVIRFRDGSGIIWIDTDYANALAADDEGLHDEALLEALGGFVWFP